MNDRFRFRAIDNREWSDEKGKIYYDVQDAYDWSGGEPEVPATSFGCIVDGEGWIVEQCTGLKDKNGNLIYEGDILKDHRQEGGIVKWNNDSAGFAIYEILETGCCVGGLFDWLDKDTNYEVIGNIHENPELLEGK